MGFNNESVDTSITHSAEITSRATFTSIEVAKSIIGNSSDDLSEVLKLYFKKDSEDTEHKRAAIFFIMAQTELRSLIERRPMFVLTWLPSIIVNVQLCDSWAMLSATQHIWLS